MRSSQKSTIWGTSHDSQSSRGFPVKVRKTGAKDAFKTFLRRAKACISMFRIKTAEGFQYRLAGLAGAATDIFWVLIEIVVYTVFYTYADNKNAGTLAGMTLQQVITYAWLTQVFFRMLGHVVL